MAVNSSSRNSSITTRATSSSSSSTAGALALIGVVSTTGCALLYISAHPLFSLEGRILNGTDTTPRGTLFAVILAFSSSTDNFAVGLSVALAGSRLPPRVNAIISACNALGALGSAGFGALIGNAAPSLAPMLAAAVFLYLAWEELSSWRRGERASPLARSASDGLVWKLAVPMTLNNLAGGVASGAVGVSPLVAGGSALGASYLMMYGGHLAGRKLGAVVEESVDPRLLAAATFLAVALAQAVGALYEGYSRYE